MTDDRSRDRSLSPPSSLPRRQALKVLGLAVGSAGWSRLAGLTGAAGLGSGLVGLSGCAPGGAKDGTESAAAEPLRVPLDRLPVGARLVVQVGDAPVELQRTADGVTGRSLRCTHFGCTVAWMPARNAYVCPCHDGVYAPDGHVIYGPPPAPLAAVPVTVEDGVIVVPPPVHQPAGAPRDGGSAA